MNSEPANVFPNFFVDFSMKLKVFDWFQNRPKKSDNCLFYKEANLQHYKNKNCKKNQVHQKCTHHIVAADFLTLGDKFG